MQLSKVQKDLRVMKEEGRELNDRFIEIDRSVKRNHEKIITLEEKAKHLKERIREKKNSSAKTSQLDDQGVVKEVINEEALLKLDERLKELNEDKESVDKQFDINFRELQKYKKDLHFENLRLSKILKEKEKVISDSNETIKL